jgi:hypothetical protein
MCITGGLRTCRCHTAVQVQRKDLVGCDPEDLIIVDWILTGVSTSRESKSRMIARYV